MFQVTRELKAVGYFKSGNMSITWYHKPNRWQRFWYMALLGWKWEDV